VVNKDYHNIMETHTRHRYFEDSCTTKHKKCHHKIKIINILVGTQNSVWCEKYNDLNVEKLKFSTWLSMICRLFFTRFTLVWFLHRPPTNTLFLTATSQVNLGQLAHPWLLFSTHSSQIRPLSGTSSFVKWHSAVHGGFCTCLLQQQFWYWND